MSERWDGIEVPAKALIDACEQIVALERELANRHKRVDELIGDVSRAEGENAGLREALTERDRRIAELEQEIADMEMAAIRDKVHREGARNV